MTFQTSRHEIEKRQRERAARRKNNVEFQAAMKSVNGQAADIEAWSDIEAELDALFSTWVRMRDALNGGRCRICQTRPIEVCYHVIPRGAHAVRWAEDNGWGACGECNTKEQQNREHYKTLHRQMMGDADYEALVARARIVEPWDIVKLTELREVLRNQIESYK